MSDSQSLLNKIISLRTPLEPAAGTGQTADRPGLEQEPRGMDEESKRLEQLERQVKFGHRHNLLLDGSLRRMTDMTAALKDKASLPAQLTARARRLLEQGRSLLHPLRALAQALAADPHSEQVRAHAFDLPADPLFVLFQKTVAMADVCLRMVQAFPDAPSAQLHLCEGLEEIMGIVAQRTAGLKAALERQQRDSALEDALAERLLRLTEGQPVDVKDFLALASEVSAEARQAAPLRFPNLVFGTLETCRHNRSAAHGNDPSAARALAVRLIACHSLMTARVAARLTRDDPDYSARPLDPILAALLHDAGMLRVPAELVLHAGPLSDTHRRTVEDHARLGAELVARLIPSAAGLAETVAAHHERIDGTGYPGGLRALQLPALSRLLAVCDVYAALCASRPQRPALDSRAALADTLFLAEQGALDRGCAERLLALAFYPVGAVVELDDGAAGIVVANHMGRRDVNTPASPVLALLTDAHGEPLPAVHHLDLNDCTDRGIARSLSPAERRALLCRCRPEAA